MADDTDGLIKLSDAQIRAAQARADIAGKMADVATKVAKLGLIQEATIKAHLENVAKWLDIQWDKQAHDHLLKIRNFALQEAKKQKWEAERVKEYAGRLGRLLAGAGSFTGIRDAWMAFTFFRGRAPATVAKKMGKLAIDDTAYMGTSWKHPEGKKPANVPEDERDLGSLWQWAINRTYFPKTGTAAWDALATYLEYMSEAADKQATAEQGEADAAEASALALAQMDWDRLKEK